MVIGVLLAALSLRGPIVAPTPVLNSMAADLGVGPSALGLLTSVPVLLFATLTPVAIVMIRRAGPDLALLSFLAAILVGTLLRAVPGFAWVLGGTVLIGAAITVGNIVVPVLIRREVAAHRVPLVTAAYAAALNAGSLLTSLGTAPLAGAIGWPLALLSWSALTCLGLLACGYAVAAARGRTGRGRKLPEPPADPTVAAGHKADAKTPAGEPSSRQILRAPVVWLLAVAFGFQCLIYYGLSTWLPTITADQLGLGSTSAGAVASIYQGVGILGALVIPVLARYTPRTVPALVVGLSTLILAVGILIHPGLFGLWLALGALGHAGGFVVIFATLVAVSRSDRETATKAAVVQGIGYSLATVGGPGLGLLHDWTGSWDVPLAAVLVVAVGYCFALCAAVAVAAREST